MQLHSQVLGGVKFYLATFQKTNNKTKKKKKHEPRITMSSTEKFETIE